MGIYRNARGRVAVSCDWCGATFRQLSEDAEDAVAVAQRAGWDAYMVSWGDWRVRAFCRRHSRPIKMKEPPGIDELLETFIERWCKHK